MPRKCYDSSVKQIVKQKTPMKIHKDATKPNFVGIRLSDEAYEKLQSLCKHYKANQSEVVRSLIEQEYENLKLNGG
ncbi:MAG: hypothetical protein Kow00121_26510 [Elainellaceae cyanobacterium]